VDEEIGTTTKPAMEGHRTRCANLIAGGCCQETGVDLDRMRGWPAFYRIEKNFQAAVSKGQVAGSAGQAVLVKRAMVSSRVGPSISADGERTIRIQWCNCHDR
jgi:hypothetical protein